MKKINYNYNEVIYTETLPNGLTVYMYPTNKTRNFYITVSTYFGAEVLKYKKDNKIYNVTKGSAHFLEHRVMDFTKNKTAMEEINKLGSIVNAYTTYKSTNYNLFGYNDILTNMKLLFDRVFHSSIKKKDVESERGIILEEYSMYQSDPYYNAMIEILSNTFHKTYLKYQVLGTEEDIKNVSYLELNRLYKDFYTPSNMFIVVCGNFNKEEVLNYIKDYTKSIKDTKSNIKILKPTEPYKVYSPYAEKTEDIAEEKVLVSYKMKLPRNKLLFKYIMNIVLNENFDKTGSSYLKLLDEGLMRFTYGLEESDNYLVIYFACSTSNKDKFINILDNELSNIDFTKEALERKIRSTISSLILNFEDILTIEDNITSNLFNYNKLINNLESIIKKITLTDVNKVIKTIDINNKSIYVIKSKTK